MSGRWALAVEIPKKMRAKFRAVLPAALLFVCIGASAQVDRGKIEPFFRDLQSSDSGTRERAFEAIRQNAEYLKDPETADRLLALLVLEQQAIKRGAAAGKDMEGGIYDSLLGTLSGLWKDKLTPQAFRVFATAFFDSDSGWAKGLGAHAGRFVSTLLPLTKDANAYVRKNAAGLVGYALASDQAGKAPLTPEDRSALRRALTAASTDPDYGVRIAVVRGLKIERDAWAIPVLQRMYARESSLHPAGNGQLPGEALRGEMKEAIQAVRSRGQMPAPDFDALQAIYRDLQSNDPQVKSQALNALVKREDFHNFVDTPDRLLQLLDLETRAIRSSAPEKGLATQGDPFYETLLATTWDLWKDRLTLPSFRILLVSVYSADSAFARELSAHAGHFMGMLGAPSSEAIPP